MVVTISTERADVFTMLKNLANGEKTHPVGVIEERQCKKPGPKPKKTADEKHDEEIHDEDDHPTEW